MDNPTNDKDFCLDRGEWLAGLIDGDGSFLISKFGYGSLEITMDTRDIAALQLIANFFGGSVKPRTGSNSVRYRLTKKSDLIYLINQINGLIRNPVRINQLRALCLLYQIPMKEVQQLTFLNGWLSGLFDSDGTITMNTVTRQISISISQKTTDILIMLLSVYGGHIYPDFGRYTSYKWYITDKETMLLLLDYFNMYPSLPDARSAKQNRILMLPLYYELIDLRAYNAAPGTELANRWNVFMQRWISYDGAKSH